MALLEVVVLVSAGRHPVSGRGRRAPADARALEMALGLAPADRLRVVHAGEPDAPALGEYLGMGLAALEVLQVAPGRDVRPVLAARLAALEPALVLTGLRAEQGAGSGFLPYALAADLGAAVVSRVTALRPEGEGYRLEQACPGGRRRALLAPAPLGVAVDPAAPAPRPVAHGARRRGRIEAREPDLEAPPLPEVEIRAPRRRAAGVRVKRGLSAAERLRAASQLAGGGGQLLEAPDPRQAAGEILRQLRAWGIVESTQD